MDVISWFISPIWSIRAWSASIASLESLTSLGIFPSRMAFMKSSSDRFRKVERERDDASAEDGLLAVGIAWGGTETGARVRDQAGPDVGAGVDAGGWDEGGVAAGGGVPRNVEAGIAGCDPPRQPPVGAERSGAA